MRTRGACAILALTGCVSVTAALDSGVSPPFNTCPAHPCTAYAQSPAPTCNGGACLVGSLYSGLVLAVSLPTDSDYAPGETLAIPYENLAAPPPDLAPCSSPSIPCAALPGYAIVQGQYTVEPSVQAQLDWDLGNPVAQSTALPVHVTYRPLWPVAGAAPVDADTLGLPFVLVPAIVVTETAPSSPPGPAAGPSIGFQANLQPGLYEVTIQPDPPFDVAFPPEVANVSLTTGTQDAEDALHPDLTSALDNPAVPGTQVPNFSVYRLPDGLSNWQAYLRDTTTRRRISSLATLGTRTNDCASTPCTVALPTNHHPPGGDALTGAEIVIAPPANLPLPTYVSGSVVAGEFAYSQQYPTLAPSQTVTGKVTGVVPSDAGDAGTAPIEAEVYFEVTEDSTTGNPTSTGIYAYEGTTTTLVLNTENFELSAETTATIDATGNATYSITLSPGVYRVTVRPLDDVHEVTVVPSFTVDPTAGPTSPDVVVDVLRAAQGSASVADGRPMAGAAVEAIPTACSTGSAASTASCMPRDQQTTTDVNGVFQLPLDPGSYTLRFSPQSGTVFPWVTQPLLVGPTPVTTVPPVTVPAPVNAGLQLFDPFGNAVIGALVRVYQVPTTGPAVEVGRAVTDTTGTYVLYLAPASSTSSSSP